MKYILLFLSGFIIDIIWALYIKAISDDKYLFAAIYSVGTGLCSLFMIHEFIENIYNGMPYLLGLFGGTYSIKYLKLKKRLYE